jgi:hypothetical protein
VISVVLRLLQDALKLFFAPPALPVKPALIFLPV